LLEDVQSVCFLSLLAENAALLTLLSTLQSICENITLYAEKYEEEFNE